MADNSLCGARVAFLGDLRLGGVFPAMAGYMSALVAMGAEVTLLTMDADGPNRTAIPAGVAWEPLRFRSPFRAYLAGCPFQASFLERAAFKMLRRTGLACANRYPDVYEYVIDGLDGGLPGPFDAVLDFLGYGDVTTSLGARVQARYRATWVHDEDVACFSRTMACVDSYDDVFCVSASVLEAYRASYPDAARRASVLYNPLDAGVMRERGRAGTAFPRVPGAPRVLSVGRLAEQKGFDVAIEAASLLDERGVPFEWVIAGDGPLRGDLQRRIDSSSLSGSVRLVGRVENSCAEMAAADLYVQPSRHEGLPVTALEATAVGAPVIATDIPPFRELVRAGAPFDLVPLDAARIADAVERALRGGEEDAPRISVIDERVYGAGSAATLASRIASAIGTGVGQ